MKRRDILKYTALATGAAISGPLFSSLLVGCENGITENGAVDQLSFFSQEEFAWVKDLIDLILPKTDSPSASDVGVHYMIDSMVGTVYPEEAQAGYRKGFTALVDHLRKAAGSEDFLQLEASKRLALLKELDAAAQDTRNAFLELKQQTIAYYLSTEEIGKNYLNYLPIPGAYDACISLDEVGGKAWAI